MRVSRLSTLAALALLALAMAVSAACAHATLVSSEPADGAMTSAPPRQIALVFNEPVSPLVLRLIGSDGKAVLLSNPPGRSVSLIVPVPAAMAQGTHVLSWRVVSLDGHPIGGSVVFSVGVKSSEPPPGPEAALDPAVSTALWSCKAVLNLGLFLGVAGSFFLAWVAKGRSEATRTMVGVLVAALFATPLSIGLQGADALGAGLSDLGQKAVWQAGLETSYGMTAITAAFALFAGLFALEAQSQNVARGLSLFGILMAGLAFTLSGHASNAAPQWLMRPTVFVHTISIAFWIGCLIPLGQIICKPDATAVLARFSRAIPVAIVALVASGLVLAVVQVTEPRFLLNTAYGQLLSAKLILVLVLLILAAWNRFHLTAPAMAGQAWAQRRLARSIAAEIAIVIAILALVAVWRFTPPPRALLIAAERPLQVHLHTAAAMADVTLEPGRAGIVQASIIIMTGDFGGLDAKEMVLILQNEEAGIEPIIRPAQKGADAVWRVDQLPVPAAGRWSLRLEILISDFEKRILEGEVMLR